MKNFHFLALLLFACWVSLPGGIAWGEEYGSVAITEIALTKPQAEATQHGCFEHRFRVTNRSTGSRQITIVLPAESYSYSTGLSRLAGSIEVPAGQTAVLAIVQPPMPLLGGDQATVLIDGYRQSRTLSVVSSSQHGGSHYGGSIQGHMLTSIRITPDVRELIRKGNNPTATTSSSSGHHTTPVAAEIAAWESEGQVGDWSTNWLAYTRFDGIAITSVEIREMQQQHPEVFTAVRQYVEAGGILYVVGNDWARPKEWTGTGSEEGFAVLGRVFQSDSSKNVVAGAVGSVRTAVFSTADIWRTSLGGGRTAYTSYGSGYTGGGILGGGDELLHQMPVLRDFRVPIRAILILILVFAVLIGPVNIFVLSQMKRRIWLLWTVPLTSIIASLMVYCVNYLQEGFLRQTATQSVTILDQTRQEAVTFGYVGFYSTFTPRGGATFDATTETTYACERSGYRDNARSLEIDVRPGGAQQMARGWIRARLPAYFAVRKAESRRKEQLEFHWEDEPNVVNHFPVDIKQVRVIAPDGTGYSAGPVTAGEKVALQKDADVKSCDLASYHIFLRNNSQDPRSWMRSLNVNQALPSGFYRAELAENTQNPFLEKAVPSANDFSHMGIVFGKY